MRNAKLWGAVSARLATALVMAFTAFPASAGDGEAPDPAQIARGAKAWAETCNRCHNIRNPKELQDYEWDVSVNHMRMVAGLPGNMARDIAAFLKASNN
ncbi:MAG: cytochrome c [Acidimicrobiia bacterium]